MTTICNLALALLLQGEILLDRTPLLKPIQDAWIDVATDRLSEPVLLKRYKDGSYLILVQPQHWPALVKGLKSQEYTIIETPLSISKGDRFSEPGGAFVILQYLKPKKIVPIDCTKPPEKAVQCWSEWAAKRQDKPDMPPTQGWSVLTESQEPKATQDYAAKVTDALRNRIMTLEKISLQGLKSGLFEAKLARLQATTIYSDLGCVEAAEVLSWLSDKHYKDCRYAWDEVLKWSIESGMIERKIITMQQEIDSYVASIAEIKQIVANEVGE